MWLLEGANPELRTFYYRLLRLISLCIHPLFVFDGPNKPPFKRNKRTGQNVSSIPEFLAKQLLKQFGLPFHIAPGEAEAECALLQQEGLVDAVLTEDVDSLMFGSGITIRNWSAEGRTNKTPTHINVHDAQKIKNGPSGLDKDGMVLVALMSGGDYLPEGIPGCGPKLACEAARAGFGAELCRISRNDKTALRVWREKLEYELHTNDSKLFKRKHSTLVVPEEFPNRQVLGYYTNPAVSSLEKVERLRQSLQWDQEIDIAELRVFAAEAFDWSKLGGAKKFIRNLAPALLVREMRLRGAKGNDADNLEAIEQRESELVKTIHGRRTHAVTDNCPELRLGFVPLELVQIDLDAEEPDDELPDGDTDLEEEGLAPVDNQDVPGGSITSTQKRGPSIYDPSKVEKIWILETFVKVGIPLKVQDWEASLRDPKEFATTKNATKRTAKVSKPRTAAEKRGMPSATLNRFAKVTKPGVSMPRGMSKEKALDSGHFRSSQGLLSPPSSQPEVLLEQEPSLRMPSAQPAPSESGPKAVVIDICSSPEPQPPPRAPDIPATSEFWAPDDLPPSVTKRRRRSPLRRTRTLPAQLDEPPHEQPRPSTPPPLDILTAMDIASSPSLPSPSRLFPIASKRAKTALHTTAPARPKTPPTQGQVSKGQQIIDILSSPASHHARPPSTIAEWIRRSQSVTPSKTRYTDPPAANSHPAPTFSTDRSRRDLPCLTEELDLTDSPSRRPPDSHLTRSPQCSKQTSDLPRQHAAPDDILEQQHPLSHTVPHAASSPRRSPRNTIPSQLPQAPPQEHQKTKHRIQLRESLEGAWKLTGVAAVDLSGPDAAAIRISTAGARRKGQRSGEGVQADERGDTADRRRAWRVSEVDVLDLTVD